MNFLNKTAFRALFFLALLTAVASAENYVSFDGQFYITYPEDWNQVDYRTVDAYLLQHGAGQTTLQYEAAFAPENSDPFFKSSYLILNVDTIGNQDQHSIDSILTELNAIFGKGIKYFPVGDRKNDLVSRSPAYDAATRTISILNDISPEGSVPLKNLLIMKFYERGIATFYFYTPDSLYEKSRDSFFDIVKSFSTENIDAALPKEAVKIANVNNREINTNDSTDDDDDSNYSSTIVIILAVIVVIIATRRKKKKKANSPE